MSDKKIAVITGGNRGIGFEACRQLASNDFVVVLTSRDSKKGEDAAKQLKDEGLDVVFHELEVTDSASISKLIDFLKKEYGKVEVLVNNAGVLIDDKVQNVEEAIRQTFEINTLAPFLLSRAVLPLMQEQNYGRVVNMSSGLGQLSEMGGGWPGYRISKTALNAVTKIIADEAKENNIKVNSMCPGWVQTDMGGANAHRTPKEATETILFLAMLPDDGISGGFFRDKQEIAW